MPYTFGLTRRYRQSLRLEGAVWRRVSSGACRSMGALLLRRGKREEGVTSDGSLV